MEIKSKKRTSKKIKDDKAWVKESISNEIEELNKSKQEIIEETQGPQKIIAVHSNKKIDEKKSLMMSFRERLKNKSFLWKTIFVVAVIIIVIVVTIFVILYFVSTYKKF